MHYRRGGGRVRLRIERQRHRKGKSFDDLLARFAVHAARRGLALVHYLAHLTVKAVITVSHANIDVYSRLVPLRIAHALGAGPQRVEKGVLIRAARRCIVIDANGDGIGGKRGKRMDNGWQRKEHPYRLTRRRSLAQAR